MVIVVKEEVGVVVVVMVVGGCVEGVLGVVVVEGSFYLVVLVR